MSGTIAWNTDGWEEPAIPVRGSWSTEEVILVLVLLQVYVFAEVTSP